MCFLFTLHPFGSNKNLWEKNFTLLHLLLFFCIMNTDAGWGTDTQEKTKTMFTPLKNSFISTSYQDISWHILWCFFWLYKSFKLFRKSVSSTQRPNVLTPCFKKVVNCIFIALLSKSTSHPTWAWCKYKNFISLNCSPQDCGLLYWFHCCCTAWSLVH